MERVYLVKSTFHHFRENMCSLILHNHTHRHKHLASVHSAHSETTATLKPEFQGAYKCAYTARKIFETITTENYRTKYMR